MRTVRSACILILVLTLSSIHAKADSFSFTGTAKSNPTEQAVDFSGALSGTTTTPDGPSQVGFFSSSLA
jgi:hypothetical protein